MYLHPHNTKWASEYLKEREVIFSAYGNSIQLHHIGSTAVKNLYAKNCIDILGVVKNILDVKNSRDDLAKVGYVAKGEYGVFGREYFSKASRKVHLHIFQEANHNINKHLNFVKILSTNFELVDELNALKTELHAKYPQSKDRYQKEKVHFYNKINKML